MLHCWISCYIIADCISHVNMISAYQRIAVAVCVEQLEGIKKRRSRAIAVRSLYRRVQRRPAAAALSVGSPCRALAEEHARLREHVLPARTRRVHDRRTRLQSLSLSYSLLIFMCLHSTSLDSIKEYMYSLFGMAFTKKDFHSMI